MRPRDTDEASWAYVEAAIRRMTPAQRVRRSVALTLLSHRMALAQIRALHPDDDERASRLRLAARYISPEIMRAAFEWPP